MDIYQYRAQTASDVCTNGPRCVPQCVYIFSVSMPAFVVNMSVVNISAVSPCPVLMATYLFFNIFVVNVFFFQHICCQHIFCQHCCQQTGAWRHFSATSCYCASSDVCTVYSFFASQTLHTLFLLRKHFITE